MILAFVGQEKNIKIVVEKINNIKANSSKKRVNTKLALFCYINNILNEHYSAKEYRNQ